MDPLPILTTFQILLSALILAFRIFQSFVLLCSALTRNIRKRRGEKVNIQVPTFMDEHTNLPSTIHMDAMGFGMGSCCLQVTFQAENLEESRVLYDQLVVIAPLVV